MSSSSTDLGPRGGWRRRRPRRRLAWPGAALLLSLAGCVSQTSQTYRSQNQRIKTGEVENTSWSNLAEIGVQNLLGEAVEYRVDERFIYTETEVDGLGSNDFDQTTVVNQPSLDVRTTLGTVVWEQGYEYRDTTNRSDTFPDSDQTRTDILQRLDWGPDPELPQVTTWFNHRTLEEDLRIDQERTELVFEISQDLGPTDYSYTFETEEITEKTVNSENDRVEHIATASHADQYFDGKLSSSVNLFLSERDNTVRSSSGTGSVQVFPVAGLSLVDTTPQISVLQNTPALIDGDDTTPTGINIGGSLSGGQVDWNIGAEVLVGTPVDEIRIVTETAIDPVFQNQFTFSVWTSADNSFWSLLTPSPQVVYEEAFRRFRILIPQVGSRYLKVVSSSSPAGAPAVNVTEIELFVGALVAGGGPQETEFEESKRSVTGNLSWRPTDSLLISYDLFAQTFETSGAGVTTRDSVRIDNGLTTLWTPSRLLDVTARAEYRTEDDEIQQDEDFMVLNGIVATHPLDTLDVVLNLTRTDRDVDGRDDLAVEAAQLTGSAQLLDTLQFDVGIERNNQDNATAQFEIRRWILTASLFAELTPNLDMTLGVRNDQADVSGPAAPVVPDPSEDRYETLFLYRPSERLTAEIRLEYVDQFAGEGLDQRYRVDWVPFRDGSLDFQLNYDRLDTASVADQQVDRYALLTRWSLNPSAFFEVNLAREEVSDGEDTDLATVALNVTL